MAARSPTQHALAALYAAASRIPEGIPPPPDRYGPLCAALAMAEPLVSQEDRDAALAELLAEHEASEDEAYREAVAGLIGGELGA